MIDLPWSVRSPPRSLSSWSWVAATIEEDTQRCAQCSSGTESVNGDGQRDGLVQTFLVTVVIPHYILLVIHSL